MKLLLSLLLLVIVCVNCSSESGGLFRENDIFDVENTDIEGISRRTICFSELFGCAPNEYCRFHTCHLKKFDGESCGKDLHCNSRHCKDHVSLYFYKKNDSNPNQ